jgi:hypothetical protein
VIVGNAQRTRGKPRELQQQDRMLEVLGVRLNEPYLDRLVDVLAEGEIDMPEIEERRQDQ